MSIARYAAAAGVPALALGGYGAYRNLWQPYREGQQIKKDLRGKIPTAIATALGAGALAGGAGFGVSKYRHGMSGYIPGSDTPGGQSERIKHALFGRTGLEGQGLPETLEQSQRSMVEAAGRAGGTLHVLGQRVRMPAPEGDFSVGGSSRTVRGRDVIRSRPGSALKTAAADLLVRELINRVVPDKAASMRFDILNRDKKSSAIAAGLGGLALGGAALAGTHLYRKRNIDSRLNKGRALNRWALPAAALIGTALGGTAGYMGGRESGFRQKDAAFDDFLKLHATNTATDRFNRRLGQTGYAPAVPGMSSYI